MKRYRGLTWDHPRGYTALAAAASAVPPDQGFAIDWERQPLEGFESHAIKDLCSDYDLVVLDHPHVGEAVAEACLWPLDELFFPEDLDRWAAGSIGASFTSYAYAGHQWALPLDSASQVQACRADLLNELAPSTWDAVRALSSRRPVALSVAGPHAFLSFCSMMAAHGSPVASAAEKGAFFEWQTALKVMDLMAELYARTPLSVRGLNPIALLASMSRNDTVALCPLVYGYVNYAVAGTKNAHALTFSDAPSARPGGRRGSTLGGTGVAISRRCQPSLALLQHLRELMSPEMQCSFIPAHEGQPSSRDAWHDGDVNTAWGDFYRGTSATLEQAWVRPRYAGYIAFQTRASQLLRDGFEAGAAHNSMLDDLQRDYLDSLNHNHQ
jgi:multiple sugar transport system substrate-binding protein